MNESVKPVRYAFYCAKCFKTLQLEERVYRKAYEGHDTCLSCRTTEKAAKILREQVNKGDLNKIESFLEKYENVTETGLSIGKLLTGYLNLKESESSLLSTIAEKDSRNAKLVHENDELMAENEKLKRILEELNHE